MPKTNFLSWDTIANSNEDVGGVNIKEGCAPSGINNAIREIMAQLRADIDGGMVYAAKAANYTAVANDNNGYLRFSAAATLSLTAVATLGADWHVFVQADGGDVIVDPNAAETINGAATITIRNGESALIISNGSAFFARINPINTVTYVEKAANYTAVAADNGGTLRFTAGATLALTAAATLGSAWRTTVINSSTGLVIVDPNAAETVNGSASVIIGPSQTAFIVCSGTAFFADIRGDTFSGPQIQGYSSGLALTTNVADATNDVDIAVGVAAADVSPYNLMQLTSALTKRLDATWVVGTNQGGLDTGAVANATYYIWLIQRSDTGVVDVLFSLSSTAPTMPTDYDRKRQLGFVVRASATNETPVPNLGPIKSSPKLTLSGLTSAEFDFPAGIKRGRIVWDNLSTNGAIVPKVHLGTASSYVTSGYSGAVSSFGTGVSSLNTSDGHLIANAFGTATSVEGWVEFILGPNNKWTILSWMGFDNTAATAMGGTSVSLSAPLTRARINLASTAFDAGFAYATWEF